MYTVNFCLEDVLYIFLVIPHTDCRYLPRRYMMSSGTLSLAGVFFGFGLKFYFNARREVGRLHTHTHTHTHTHMHTHTHTHTHTKPTLASYCSRHYLVHLPFLSPCPLPPAPPLQMSEFLIQAYKNGSFQMVVEMTNLRDRLFSSHLFALLQVQQQLLALVRTTHSLATARESADRLFRTTFGPNVAGK